MNCAYTYQRLYFILAANICSFSVGTYIGWSSPTLPILRNATEENPLPEGITLAEEGWILSLAAIGALCTSIIAGPIAAIIGRKRSLLLSSTILAAAYVSMLVARSVLCMYLGRFLQGAGGGFLITVLPMYVGEIATDDVRGSIGSLMSLFMTGGLLYVYCIGPYVSYWALQWFCLAVPVVFFLIFSFMPESPYFYAIKGKQLEGIKALQFLRGQSLKTVEEEMIKIQASVDNSMANRGSLVDIFSNKIYRKSLLICCGLLVFQQLSGTTAIGFNSQTIFSSANSTIDPAIATIIIGVVQLFSNLLTPFIVDRSGRKMILYITSAGMCLSLWVLGTYFYLQYLGKETGLNWIPVPALMIFNFLYGFGYGPIPYVVASEMFPTNIKPKAMTIASCVSSLTKFLIAKFYPQVNALGPYYAFWGFGGCCLLALFFVCFFTIETKRISLEDIQERLYRRRTSLQALKKNKEVI
ncbi:facilitated trehalose transporter Tret1-like [Episyrphus balteatus]|uniref:facilitated trehalose transporter Tret1-like n=1 Tax=Episyrphus balteatus TaxID=286459 RepID=UPI002485BD4F|nr:facilitated trehalose transporter Tret1-like [Episyrphus balteatus]